MKSVFDLYIGQPDYEYFVICHGKNKYLDEDFVICLQVVKWLQRRLFINLMCEKLHSADAVEMGIDKHMVASLYRQWNNAISMSLVSNSFSYMDISSFGCLIRS